MQKDLMVASDLQRTLLAEIGKLLEDLRPYGKQYTGFEQQLPVLRNADDDPDQFFPYYIIRIVDGKTETDDDLWTITVDILIGVCDEDFANEGHFHVMLAINRITTRFCKEPTLGERGHMAFRCLPEMEWGLQDTDSYPYYFGGVELKFLAPKPRRSESNGFC